METQNTTQDVNTVAAPAVSQQTVNIITDTMVLTSKNIYASMSQFGENPKDYSATSSMAGEQYYTFKCKGAMINVPIAFQEAFVARKLYSVTITGRAYERPVADATVAGGSTKKIEQSWQYDTHMTIDDYKAAIAGDNEITELEIAMSMQQEKLKAAAKKAQQVKLTDTQEQELLTRLEKLIA